MASFLLLGALGCATPVEEAAPDAAAEDSGGEEQVDLDPGVDSYFPENYVAADPARVVYLGDSITAGNGATRPGLSYVKLLKDNDDDTWPDAAELDLAALWGDVPEIVDESSPGATTSTLAFKQLDDVSEAIGDTVSGPTVVILTIAGNDVQQIMFDTDETEATVAKIKENLDITYDYFEDPARFPDGAYVYLANVYEPSDGVGQADECFYGLDLTGVLPSLQAVNDATREQAEERGVGWIDLHGHFLGHGYHGSDPENPYYEEADPSLWFAEDCIHPNDRGHHELRRLFWYAAAGQEFPGDAPQTAE